jgi:Protein of unknown function (DUF2889)
MADTATSDLRGDPGTAVHRRTLEFESHTDGEQLRVVGRLRDSRPWAEGTWAAVVHDMELRVTVRTPDLVITEAEAHMHTFPHTECADIAPAFAGLVGVPVARGYTRALRERFGGVSGCSHLVELARALGPAVLQSVVSNRHRADDGAPTAAAAPTGSSPWLQNSCHIWAEDGIGEQKIAAGWRPGLSAYPAPTLETWLADPTVRRNPA